MSIIKKILKIISILLSVIIILTLLIFAGLFINHCIRLSGNKKFLEEKGYYHLVSAGDHNLNLITYGGAEEKHRIIALGGNGAGFPVELQKLADELSEDGAVYYLARPGYDGSDDVKEDMTVDFVVEDYRSALRNAGIEAPYVLMPHSYASILATYWESRYPDEIEAMIDLDGVVARTFTDEEMEKMQEEDNEAAMRSLRVVMNTGIGDAAIRVFNPEKPEYSEDEQRISDAMTLMTMGSRAFSSEIRCVTDNILTTWEMMQPNDVPKLYINAENGYHTLEELKAADVLSEYRINELTPDFEGSPEERRKKAYEMEWELTQEYKKEKIQPFVEKLGNCQIADLPGSHFIHWEKPEECGEIIRDFLNNLN
ncbi:MAG: alpha/beta hydrolase [Oscillospiraceae bacterium]|nr:alpha/beta hydrolase [Oscillospiraceae bacterium]